MESSLRKGLILTRTNEVFYFRLRQDSLVVASESDTEGVKSVSIVALLLAAYEEHPPTLSRRKGYTVAMEFDFGPKKRSMPVNELQPA